MKRKTIVVWCVIFIVLLSIVGVCAAFIDNKNIEYERFELNPSENPDTAGITVAHLTDLHFPKIKIDTRDLLERLANESADIIAITGDLIDGGADLTTCGVYAFIEKLSNIAPIYYVSGNHEAAHPDGEGFLNELEKMGVAVLRNESLNITVRNKKLTLIGLTDNADYDSECYQGNTEIRENYKILLAHRPEKWPAYCSDQNVVPPDLVLSGHAHGGQIRFFNRGLFAPGQGVFPKYDSGLYVSDHGKSKMIVSRGIGNSIVPFRFNNRPHVPIVKIYG